MSDQITERLSALEKENSELKETIRQKDLLIRRTFGKYLTDEVLNEILQQDDPEKLAGEKREVTILFADMRDSTKLSESMSAMSFVDMLNHFLGEMIEIINAWQGNILDFVGDSLVVVYGAPKENQFSAIDAVASAVAMQRRMPAVNKWNMSQGYPSISIGIGINTGEAVLGTIGSETRSKYDMIGRSVNLAARIEGFTEGGQILISSETLREAGDKVLINPSGEKLVKPKGIQSEVLLHDVIGIGTRRIPRYLTESNQ